MREKAVKRDPGFIYSPSMINKDGKKIKKVSLIMIDGDEKLCDCCDEKKICASIDDLSSNVMCICKDCLKLIINEF